MVSIRSVLQTERLVWQAPIGLSFSLYLTQDSMGWYTIYRVRRSGELAWLHTYTSLPDAEAHMRRALSTLSTEELVTNVR
jgi:hypothetical protein